MSFDEAALDRAEKAAAWAMVYPGAKESAIKTHARAIRAALEATNEPEYEPDDDPWILAKRRGEQLDEAQKEIRSLRHAEGQQDIQRRQAEKDRDEALKREVELKEENGRLRFLCATSAPPPRWIPCSERMPDDDVLVLVRSSVMVGTSHVIMACYALTSVGFLGMPMKSPMKKWQLAFSGSVLGGVTHWMPLPEPPQE